MNNLVVVLLKSIKYFTGILIQFFMSQCYSIGQFFPWVLLFNILILKHVVPSFIINYLHIAILHIIMSNLVIVSLKSTNIKYFTQTFEILHWLQSQTFILPVL